jgi:hypothetical protein
MWRLAHNSLAVHRNLVRLGMKDETICPMYNRLDEDCGQQPLCKQDLGANV